jgi:HK97 family phage major capsid protein
MAIETEIQESLQALQGKLAAATDEIKSRVEEQLHEIRTKGVADPETTKSINTLRQQMSDMQAEMRRPNPHIATQESKSLGQRFIESDELKDMIAKRGGRGRAAMNVPYLWEAKTLIDSAAVGSSTPGILNAQRVPGIVPLAERQLRIRDLLAQNRTTNNAVDFVKENAFTNAASPQGVDGTAKGESADTFVIDSERVTTIAHWIPASRQVLDDLPQLRSFIDRKLMYGLKLKEETELLSGDDLGTHLNGLYTQATAYAGTYAVSGDTRVDTLNWAILELEDGDDQATGIILNPVDYRRIMAIKTEEGGANKGSYVTADPMGGVLQVPTMWGIPVVRSNSIASGRFLVGNFAMAEIYDRQDAVIDLSTDYDDYFVKNKVALRAEERLTVVCYRPTAFIKGTF